MKLISFLRDGSPSFGAISDSGVLDLGRALGSEASDIKTLLAKDLVGAALDLLGQKGPRVSFADLQLLPVIPNPGKIVCVGLNYHDHVVETQRPVTAHPTLFLRLPESQAAHGAGLVLPAETTQFDYEGEIAVIIGRRGRRISESNAWAHIAGYACYNDGSVRDWQAAANQWTAGKNFSATGGFGPWMVTADEVPAGTEMTLVTRVNGKEMQRASTGQMIHSIPQLLRHISTFTTLEPGDVIVTGTPGGIGSKRKPPVFLGPEDIVEIDVDKIGVLHNHVLCEVAESEGVFVSGPTRGMARSG